MKNTGKTSQETWELKTRVRHGKLCFIHRLADASDLTGLNRGLSKKKTGFVATLKLPSDYLVTIDGVMFYAEVKSSQNATSFPFANFEEGQWQAMRQQRAARGEYWVFIHNLNTDFWYRVPGNLILNTKDDGRMSLKWDELKPYFWSF